MFAVISLKMKEFIIQNGMWGIKGWIGNRLKKRNFDECLKTW